MTVTSSSCTTGSTATCGRDSGEAVVVSMWALNCIRKWTLRVRRRRACGRRARGPAAAAGRRRSGRAAQAERVGLNAHELDHVLDVLIQRNAELLGATTQ